jgi:hypothetical protein
VAAVEAIAAWRWLDALIGSTMRVLAALLMRHVVG